MGLGGPELMIVLVIVVAWGLRKAAHRGLQSIELEMLDKGFLEIVRERNKLGRMLGYADYYDYKVTRNEGFSKKVLFDILDDLEWRGLIARDDDLRGTAILKKRLPMWQAEANLPQQFPAQRDQYCRLKPKRRCG